MTPAVGIERCVGAGGQSGDSEDLAGRKLVSTTAYRNCVVKIISSGSCEAAA